MPGPQNIIPDLVPPLQSIKADWLNQVKRFACRQNVPPGAFASAVGVFCSQYPDVLSPGLYQLTAILVPGSTLGVTANPVTINATNNSGAIQSQTTFFDVDSSVSETLWDPTGQSWGLPGDIVQVHGNGDWPYIVGPCVPFYTGLLAGDVAGVSNGTATGTVNIEVRGNTIPVSLTGAVFPWLLSGMIAAGSLIGVIPEPWNLRFTGGIAPC